MRIIIECTPEFLPVANALVRVIVKASDKKGPQMGAGQVTTLTVKGKMLAMKRTAFGYLIAPEKLINNMSVY